MRIRKNKIVAVLLLAFCYIVGHAILPQLTAPRIGDKVTVLKFGSLSPWSHCAADPLNAIDPLGEDTVTVSYSNDKWVISNTIINKGDDVFIFKQGNYIVYSRTVSEGEYGNRLSFIDWICGTSPQNLTLGIFHLSGTNLSGYFVVPGGKKSNENGSGRAIEYGEYKLVNHKGGKWTQPKIVGNNVDDRNVLIHSGYGTGAKLKAWTTACFVVSDDYKIVNGKIHFDRQSSESCLEKLDKALGGKVEKSGMNRIGATFKKGIKQSLIYK